MRLNLPYKTIDWLLAVTPLILLSFGIAVIFSLAGPGSRNTAINQIISTVIGIVTALILMFVDYRTWKSLAWPLYLSGLVTLVLVLFLGSKTFGATRWIDFGIFQFQPSEVMKLFVIIAVARLISIYKVLNLKNILTILCVLIPPTVLVLIQPDLGSASVMMFVTLVMLLTAGIPKKILLIGFVIGLLLLPIGYKSIAPYQRERIKTFLEPEADPSGSGYNVRQSKIAVGSGGVWGRGLGRGSQSQLNFLPVAHTDFIFAGIAEATGFVGSIIVIGLIALIIVRALIIAHLSQDLFGMYLSVGIASLYLYQTFVNIGGNLGLVPVTGIPLPFVSFGGTATIMFLSGIGLLESIYLRHKKIRFD